MGEEWLSWGVPVALGLAAARLLRPMSAIWLFDVLVMILFALLLDAVLLEQGLALAAYFEPYALIAGFAIGQLWRRPARARAGRMRPVERGGSPGQPMDSAPR